MDLSSLRSEIDSIDSQILELFKRRMEINIDVAKYKQANNMQIFQQGRENQVIDRVKNNSPDWLQNGTESLFLQIMDIGKSIQQQTLYKDIFMEYEPLVINDDSKVACFGIQGSNTEQAVLKIFPNCKNISYIDNFEDICQSVEDGINDFGVIAIQNSTSGSINATYDLLKKHNLYITNTIDIPISHCLAVKEGTQRKDIKKVYSHPQGFAQCSQFMEKGHFEAHEYGNTSLSAKHVFESNEPIGAICSEHCAKLYGLVPLIKDISDVLPNYTKFVCVSNKFKKSKDANIISVILTIPHVKGSLYRILTKFFVCGLNLVKLESRPMMDGSFEVAFYLDFEGNVDDVIVSSLLTSMRNELEYFKFLGNYSHIA